MSNDTIIPERWKSQLNFCAPDSVTRQLIEELGAAEAAIAEFQTGSITISDLIIQALAIKQRVAALADQAVKKNLRIEELTAERNHFKTLWEACSIHKQEIRAERDALLKELNRG